jgi:membrane protease YdiL (CAAX protease family)
MKQPTLLRLVAALLAILVAGVGATCISPMLSPLDYLGITAPRVLYWIPLVLAVLGYFLIAWRAPTVHEKRNRLVGYGVRFSILLILCAIGFYTPFAYRERNVEFISVPGKELRFEQAAEFERTLGFKVGIQSGDDWQRVFFKRAPGRAEKVREILQQQKLSASAVNLAK